MIRKKGPRLNTQADSTVGARNFILFNFFPFPRFNFIYSSFSMAISATYVCYETSKPRITFFCEFSYQIFEEEL